jgi:hypothetical protein
MGGRDVVAFGLDRHYLQDIYFYAMTSSWTMFFFRCSRGVSDF